MAKETPNHIADIRKGKGLTQAQLAEKLGVHWVTVSKLERGKIQLHTGWMDEIAKALEVHPLDLISNSPDTKEIAITGSIGDDGNYTDFRDDDNNRDWFQIDLPVQPVGSEFGFWVVIEGDRCWPIFHDGDKLHFTSVLEDEAEAYVGRYVILENGSDRSYTGYLVSASGDRCDIQVINGKTYRNLKAKDMWVLIEVRYAWPQEHFSHPREPDADDKF